MDAAEEIGGTASGHDPLSSLAHDQGAADDAERGCVGGDGRGLHGSQRQWTLPALARQIYYQVRPKIMAATDDKELAYGYFSQTLLPDYIEEHSVDWNVVYDARGHFTEPHTNRRIGCGTIEVGNYLHAVKDPKIVPAEFADASVDVVGPSAESQRNTVL